MPLYPVNLDIRSQLCLIIGGGIVAGRKVEALLPCEPRILVVSPVVCQRIADLAEKQRIEWKQRKYEQGDLAGAKLVFAATDNRGTQEQIVAEADAAGILVNVITAPDACSFQVPATCRQGDLLITVATGGGSPALAARIRKELEGLYGPEYGLLLFLMACVRQQVVASSAVSAEHKIIFENLLDSDILQFIKTRQWTRLTEILGDILPSDIKVSALIKKLQTQEKTEMETLSC